VPTIPGTWFKFRSARVSEGISRRTNTAREAAAGPHLAATVVEEGLIADLRLESH
jgi:hypothetical protein